MTKSRASSFSYLSESIRARVASLGVTKRNASDGISYIQVAEGDAGFTTRDDLVHMRVAATNQLAALLD